MLQTIRIRRPVDLLGSATPALSAEEGRAFADLACEAEEVCRPYGLKGCIGGRLLAQLRTHFVRHYVYCSGLSVRQALVYRGENLGSVVFFERIDGVVDVRHLECRLIQAGQINGAGLAGLRSEHCLTPEQMTGAFFQQADDRMGEFLRDIVRGLMDEVEVDDRIGAACALSKFLGAQFAATVRSGIARFHSALAPDVLDVVRPVDDATAQRYSFYLGHSPLSRRNRIQAARSYPVLQNVLPDLVDAVAAIDSGLPLAPEIARLAQVRSGATKLFRFSGYALPNLGALKALSLMAARIPADHLPRDGKSLGAMVHFGNDLLPGVTRRNAWSSDNRPEDEGHNTAWARELAADAFKTSWEVAVRSLEDRGIAHVHDFLRAVESTLKESGIDCNRDDPNRPLIRLLRATTLSRLLRWSDEWHRRLRFLQNQVDETSPGESTSRRQPANPALLKSPRIVGDYVFTPLFTPEALRAEGRRMGHCVGGYSAAVARGDSFIFSVSDQGGNGLWTLELAVDPSSLERSKAKPQTLPVVLVRQLFGPHNRCADREGHQAARRLVEMLNEGRVDGSLPAFWRRLRRCALRARGNGPGFGEDARYLDARRKAVHAILDLRPMLRTLGLAQPGALAA